jgi:hypothetical protein
MSFLVKPIVFVGSFWVGVAFSNFNPHLQLGGFIVSVAGAIASQYEDEKLQSTIPLISLGYIVGIISGYYVDAKNKTEQNRVEQCGVEKN